MILELSPGEVDELLRAQVVGRIGCHAGGLTYVVPVIYAYADDGVYVASIEGQKIRMMRENPRICFEVDEYDGAGGWRSVIVQGVYEELDAAGAEHAVRLLAERFRRGGEGGPRRERATDGRPTVCFRIRVLEATGRRVAR
jgi:nitroimidazol reductase NimA-like FMN-containing flavoprotein (pyridoxamine 5'-phosphate oxidase superfamily)